MQISPYLKQLTDYMRGLSSDESKRLAFEISLAVNTAILQENPRIHLMANESSESLSRILIDIPILPTSIALPWQAQRLSRLDEQYIANDGIDGVAAILATIPSDYGIGMPMPDDMIGPYAGSLLDHLCELINGARSIQVVNPYWSIEGSKEIARRLVCGSGNHERALVLTQAKLDRANRAGLEDFVRVLENMGFSVECWIPKPLHHGDYPLVHAKVMIADQRRAYIGSANLTQSGLNHSIEIGVCVEGPKAMRLHKWFENLMSNFECVQLL